MAHRLRFVLVLALLPFAGLAAACSDDGIANPSPSPSSTTAPSGTASVPPSATATTSPDGGTTPPPSTGGDAETPATGDPAAVKAWLDSKAYTKWACEPTPHARRTGSGHSANRICSNGLLSQHGAGEYPVGAASVKELFDGNNNLNGYAMLLKLKAGGAESFYWYELIGSSLVANGPGDTGSAKSVCTGCHSGAGMGGQTGHDSIFTQVK